MAGRYKELTKCLACKSKELFQFMDLGYQVLANQFLDHPKELPRFPLQANFCKDCSHVQLSIAIDSELLFANYLYTSGTTETLKKHFSWIAATALVHRRDKEKLGFKPKVLVIGVNDGSEAVPFIEWGFEVHGVDPAENLAPLSRAVGVKTLVDYWSPEAALRLPGEAFDIILSQNSFAHNPDPEGFLKACHRVADNDTIVVIQFPYAAKTFMQAQFQQIYHEHISFFNVRSFNTLAERCGFYIDRLEQVEIHGGSVIFFLKKGTGPIAAAAKELILKEEVSGLKNFETYNRFAFKSQDNILKLSEVVDKHIEGGGFVVSYGASAKSTVLFETPIGKKIAKKVTYCIDDAELKQGKWLPGSNVHIKSTKYLTFDRSKEVLIICNAFNFIDEIKSRLRAVGVKGKIVNFVPTVEVEDI